MRITKDKFQSWEEDVEDEDYVDELIITLKPNETSLQMAEYILLIQDKADEYDKMISNKFGHLVFYHKWFKDGFICLKCDILIPIKYFLKFWRKEK